MEFLSVMFHCVPTRRSLLLSGELVRRAVTLPPEIPLPVILGAMFKETAAETTEPQEVLVLRSLNGEACFLVTLTLEAYLPSKMRSFPTAVTHTLT